MNFTRGRLPEGRGRMTAESTVLWVVYKMTIHVKNGEPVGVNAVCQQAEWDAMELARPGYHRLIQGGITNEGEAERLARGAPATVGTRSP
jgi:hypothetical protein